MNFFKTARKIFLTVFLAISIGGCGSSSQSSTDGGPDNLSKSQLVKAWQCKDCGVSDTVTVTSSGVFTSSYCGVDGKISKVTPDSSCPDGASTCGILDVTVNTTNGKSGCIAKGSNICSYITWSIYLTLNCGGGADKSRTYYWE